MSEGIWLRFLSGPDIDALGLTRLEIVDAVEEAVREHGEGRTAFEPRVHLTPDNGGIGHFNILRGHLDGLGEHGVSGVKVVGDFVPNYLKGLPSELAMATLFDPTTGVPLAVLDAHIARVCHVHCKDVRPAVLKIARNRNWSFLDAVLAGAFTVPGDGAIDFAAVVARLARHGYCGWLVVEAEQDPAVAPSFEYAQKGYRTLRALVDAPPGASPDATKEAA